MQEKSPQEPCRPGQQDPLGFCGKRIGTRCDIRWQSAIRLEVQVSRFQRGLIVPFFCK